VGTLAMNADPQAIAAALGGEVSGGQVLAPGPGHSAADRSLSIKLDSAALEGFVVHSFAGDDPVNCRVYVREKLGLPDLQPKKSSNSKAWSPVTASYIYRDRNGTPYLRVQRTATKQFFQQHWDGANWTKGKPQGPKIPYRLPELLAADSTTPIYVCEGEKDADNLAKLDFLATCNSGGADPGNGRKWTAELNTYFKDRHVRILPDNDAPGRQHAQHVARSLYSVAASVRIIDLPGLPPKGDVTDWLETDPSGARLVQACERARLWEPDAEDVRISELAGLSKFAYARRRKEEAEKLGITAAALDDVVKDARIAASGGKLLFEHWNIEPWPEAIDSAALFGAVEARLRQHIVADDAIFTAATLWVGFAWTHDTFVHSAILLATSKEPNSGKTTLLELLKFLVPRGLSTAEISAAALYRAIEKWRPTLLVDEADTIFKQNDALRGVFNTGWTRGSGVLRCNAETLDPEHFSTFGPKVIGMKGLKLPDTTLGRSIVLEMKRKRRSENVSDFLYADDAELRMLRGQLARWAMDSVEEMSRARPTVPDGFQNRLACNWRPLFAIADLCGGKWPEEARKAARALSKEDAASLYVQALAAIKVMFDERAADKTVTPADAGRMFSQDIVDRLVAIEDGPWKFYSGKDRDKPITQGSLARLLKPIAPQNIRIQGKQSKGYWRHQFDGDFERYLDEGEPSAPDTPQNNPSQRPICNEIRTSDDFNPSQGKNCGTDAKCEKSNNDGIWDAGTDCFGGSGRAANGNGAADRRCDYCGQLGRASGSAFGDMGPWDWPPDHPTRTIWLHERCEAPWHDSNGLPEGVR
jgi:Protein of unknown function (DUF3631)